jgi:hypothetical protein
MHGEASDEHVQKRRRLISAQAACLSAISRLDPDDLYELGLIIRLQEIADMVEADLNELAHPN